MKKAGVGGVICRSCNLSIPFHGCLLDFGTCRTKPGQYCIKEVHIKGGIQWYSVQGCTESQDECFKRIVTTNEIHSTHCCHRPLSLRNSNEPRTTSYTQSTFSKCFSINFE
eukprot:bmy_21216T0